MHILLPVLEEVESLDPLGQQVETLLLRLWLVQGSQLHVSLLEGFLDAPVLLLPGGVVLDLHLGVELGELGGDEVVEVVGGVLEEEAGVVGAVVVIVPGSPAVEGVVGDEAAIGLHYQVLHLHQDRLEPEYC